MRNRWLGLAFWLLAAGIFRPAGAGETLYTPPPSPLPETLASFPQGQITAAEFSAALRKFLAAAGGADGLRTAAAAAERDLRAFAQRAGVPAPEPMRIFGWDAAIAMSGGGRDFTWQEALNFLLADILHRPAGAPERLMLRGFLRQMLMEKIVRSEARAIAPEAAASAERSADGCLRQALAPLFTAEALKDFYEKNLAEFTVLKVAIQENSASRTAYVAGGKFADALPITAYGVDFVRVNGEVRSPLVTLPQPLITALLRDGQAVAEDGSARYRLTARMLPRNPLKVLPVIGDIRLAVERDRLLRAVLAKTSAFAF